MTLRDRCEALVREWREKSDALYPRGTVAQNMNPETRYEIEGRCEQRDADADALQAALDATADEGRDAARYRWLRDVAWHSQSRVFDEPCQHLDAAIDAAMKDTTHD